MNNQDLAKAILANVGGKKNIISYTNCVTRLRFQLRNEDKVDQQALDRLEGVLGVQFQGNEFQVILGGKVVHVANEFSELVPLSDESTETVQTKSGGKISNLLNTLSSILTPALPPVIAGGMLKGFIFMFLNFGWLDGSSDTLIFFNSLSDAMFYFFPFLLAVSSAKKFKTNEYLALTLAGLMMYPMAIADGQQFLKLFGILPVAVVDYSSSVLPIIFSVWLLKYVKRFFDAHIPEMVTMIFSPLLTLLITAPIAMIVLAPSGFYIGEFIAKGINWLIDLSPWIAGFVIGGTRPLLVLGGMHHALNPIAQQEIASFGSSQMLAMILMSTLAQATAPLIVYFKAKSNKEKQVALSAVLPGYIGITEPSIYGVLVKYKGAMIAACLGGGVGAAISTMLGGRCFGFVMPGLLSLPAFMGEGFMGIILGMIASVLITAVLTFVLMDRFQAKTEASTTQADEAIADFAEADDSFNIHTPVIGEMVPLESIDDATFSKEILGKTIAINSADGKIYAPFDAVVKAVFPTKHAIGLASLDGNIEILIHVGLDTVALEGEGFDLKIQQGDIVQKGEVLLTFDAEQIRSNQLADTVIVVLTNSEKFKTINKNQRVGNVDLNENLFAIVL